MSSTVLTISKLNLSFVNTKNKADSLFLLRNFTAEIPQNKITALIGGNGTGKTTLFNVICGIQKGASGSIKFKNRELLRLSTHKIAQLGIGRLFQGARIFDSLSVLDNLLLSAKMSNAELPFYDLVFHNKSIKREKQLTQRAEETLITLFGENNHFWLKKDDPAANLSFGQQRLLSLAMLMMSDYDLYLLDEPTAGVHIRFIEEIAEAIKKLGEKKTVLMIEHNMEFVRKNADNCLFLNDGAIIAKGTPDDILNNTNVQKTYLGY